MAREEDERESFINGLFTGILLGAAAALTIYAIAEAAQPNTPRNEVRGRIVTNAQKAAAQRAGEPLDVADLLAMLDTLTDDDVRDVDAFLDALVSRRFDEANVLYRQGMNTWQVKLMSWPNFARKYTNILISE